MRLSRGSSLSLRAKKHGRLANSKGANKKTLAARAHGKIARFLIKSETNSHLAAVRGKRKFAAKVPQAAHGMRPAEDLSDIANHVERFIREFETCHGMPSNFVRGLAHNTIIELNGAVRIMVAQCENQKPPLRTNECGVGGPTRETGDSRVARIEAVEAAREGFRAAFGQYVGVLGKPGSWPHTKFLPPVMARENLVNAAHALYSAIQKIIVDDGNIKIKVSSSKQVGGTLYVRTPAGGGDDDPPTTKRGKGVSEFSGILPNSNENIFVRGGEFLKVCKQKFFFEGAAQWDIVNRFLRSIANCDDNSEGRFPVTFTTRDNNKCKGNCRALIQQYIERQPASNPIRNHQYEERARFRVELLK